MAFEKDPNEIGALWRKAGAKGEYLSGTIDLGDGPVKVVCFAVKQSSDKSPAWRVLKSIGVTGSAPTKAHAPVRSPDSDDMSF